MTTTSQRVSVYEIFMVVTRYDDDRYPPVWALVDLSGQSVHYLDSGRGEPPERHYPLK